MINRHKRSKLAWLTLLAAAMTLPGLALAHGDRDWDHRHTSGWYGSDRHYERERHHDRHHNKHRAHRGRPDVVVVERPVYRRPHVTVAPWGARGADNEITVILRRNW
jgi:hypothetical protein